MELSPASACLFSQLLERHSGQQLSPGRSWRIGATLAPLLRVHGIGSFDDLARLIAAGGQPMLEEAIVDALVNHETFFFRDWATFALLTDVAIPRLAARRQEGRRLTIWCAGCSTGQEAYSLAMALAEAERWRGWRIDIVATDVSRTTIEKAREGVYSQLEVQRGLPGPPPAALVRAGGARLAGGAGIARARPLRDVQLARRSPGARRVRRRAVPQRPALLLAAVASAHAAAPGGLLADDGVLMLGAGEAVLGETDKLVADLDCRGLYRVAAGAAPVAATAKRPALWPFGNSLAG